MARQGSFKKPEEKKEEKEKEKEKKGTEYEASHLGRWLLGIGVPVVLILMVIFCGWFLKLLGAMGIVVSAFLMLYFWGAPTNFLCAYVPEGWISVVVRGGRVRKFLCNTRSKRVLQNGKVEELPAEAQIKRRALGGFFWLGVPFLDQVGGFFTSWTSVHEDGALSHHRDEYLTRFPVIPAPYAVELINIEGKAEKPIPMRAVVTYKGQVTDIYRFLFGVEDSLKTVPMLLRSHIRDIVNDMTPEQMMAGKKDIAKRLAKGLKKELGKINGECGFNVPVDSIGVMEVDPMPEYREFTTRKANAELNAEVRKLEGHGEASYIQQLVDVASSGPLASRVVEMRLAKDLSPDVQAVWLGGGLVSSTGGQSILLPDPRSKPRQKS